MGGSDSKEAELIPVRLLQSRKYLKIEPNVLHFSFETEEQTSCSMQMTNITDYHIGFQVNGPTCFGKYTVQPNVGSVPPRCTVHVILTMQTQKETVPDMQCNDTCLVQSIVVREGTSDDDIRMHIEFKRYLLDEVKLKVVYVPPQFDSDSNKLLEIEPNQLHFSVETEKQTSCSMHMTNITDDYVAFKVKTNASGIKKYQVQPNNGIVPPRSTIHVILTMQKQKEAPPDMQCKDIFLVQSVVVREGTSVEDITTEMFKKDAGNVVDAVKLKVVYVLPPQPPLHLQDGSKQSLLPHPSWLDRGNMNYQDTGSTQHHMTLQHLKDITNNFCKERILGKGGFGVVYKGVLGNGKMIAVKKLVQAISSSQEQFENEVNLLMELKHPNIVQLVGYCYETQHLHNIYEGKSIFAWNTECLLCLECLPKGSLENYISDASSGLDWPTRYKIIEEISRGLQYLHDQDGCPIIHLDLKPANILLDENMTAKITDFGLSRLYDQSKTIHTANTSGTLGYMPPEYLRGIITPMSDIFSLGVIIMELITGHRDYPYDIRESSMFFIELELQKWKSVLQKEPGYSLEEDCQQIKRCIQIGLICVNPERTKRPTMKKIIDMLQGLESMSWYISNELSNDDSKADP